MNRLDPPRLQRVAYLRGEIRAGVGVQVEKLVDGGGRRDGVEIRRHRGPQHPFDEPLDRHRIIYQAAKP
jgi:hypothetical protein